MVSSGTLKQSEEASGETAKQTPSKLPSEHHIKTKIIIPALRVGRGKAREFWKDEGGVGGVFTTKCVCEFQLIAEPEGGELS